ncbi:MAG: hypothetical protein HY904_13985 [Deltaproteobacteria bacterium]|nr:hypothetical protein [Deltaproteobacteria bacterium]
MNSPVVIAVLLLASAPAAAADEGCRNPWTVVLKKDATTVEGWLVADTDKGILIEVDGRTQLVPEQQIDEVVEDCARVRAAVPAPAPGGGSQRPAARPAKPTLKDTEAVFRNSFIDNMQRGMRWFGGGCVSLGCGLCSTGMVIGLITLVNALQVQANLLVTAGWVGLVTVLFGGAAGLLVGAGAGLIFGAQFTDLLRPDVTAPSTSPEADPAVGVRGALPADGFAD